MIRIALDNQVPLRTIDFIESNGYKVVYWAGDIHDELWFREAQDEGAIIFVSPDSDIHMMAYRRGLEYVDLPQGVRGMDLAKVIVERLNKVKSKALEIASEQKYR